MTVHEGWLGRDDLEPVPVGRVWLGRGGANGGGYGWDKAIKRRKLRNRKEEDYIGREVERDEGLTYRKWRNRKEKMKT